MAMIWKHGENDWCHICGHRVKNLSDVWYPTNAEHFTDEDRYIRICAGCAGLIKDAAMGLKPGRTRTDPAPKARPKVKITLLEEA